MSVASPLAQAADPQPFCSSRPVRLLPPGRAFSFLSGISLFHYLQRRVTGGRSAAWLGARKPEGLHVCYSLEIIGRDQPCRGSAHRAQSTSLTFPAASQRHHVAKTRADSPSSRPRSMAGGAPAVTWWL